MSRAPMRLQFKVGQCVSGVLEDANLKDEHEITRWVAECVARARLTIREADRASRERRKEACASL